MSYGCKLCGMVRTMRPCGRVVPVYHMISLRGTPRARYSCSTRSNCAPKQRNTRVELLLNCTVSPRILSPRIVVLCTRLPAPVAQRYISIYCTRYNMKRVSKRSLGKTAFFSLYSVRHRSSAIGVPRVYRIYVRVRVDGLLVLTPVTHQELA